MIFQLDKRSARVAGLLYLLVAILGIFPEFAVRGSLPKDNPALATASILNNEGWFRLALASDVLCQLCHFFLVLVLYWMFKHVNRYAALLMLACVVASVAMTLSNLTHFATPLLLLHSEALQAALPTKQLHALVALALQQHAFGYTLAGVFFGIWLYPLGVLLQQSGRFPAVLGWALKIACFAYLIDTFVTLLAPQWKDAILPGLMLAGLAELAFCLYLLVVGLNSKNSN